MNIFKKYEEFIGKKDITWKKIIILAITCGIVTGIILNFQKYIENLSIFNIGTCFEFWIFITLIIVGKSKKPLEAGLKTFIFFLISQPLVYLMEVPFNELGWGIYKYYPSWFVWTILTFPGAMIAWRTNKKDWLSLAIYVPAILFLSIEFGNHSTFFITHMPFQFLATVFIFLQIAQFTLSFKDKAKRTTLGIISTISLIGLSILMYYN